MKKMCLFGQRWLLHFTRIPSFASKILFTHDAVFASRRSPSVEVGGAVPEHEGHDVLEELPFLFVSPRPQDFYFVASEDPLIVFGRSNSHMLSLFGKFSRIAVLWYFENWLHQDDGA